MLCAFTSQFYIHLLHSDACCGMLTQKLTVQKQSYTQCSLSRHHLIERWSPTVVSGDPFKHLLLNALISSLLRLSGPLERAESVPHNTKEAMCVFEGFVTLWNAVGLMVITLTRGSVLQHCTQAPYLYKAPLLRASRTPMQPRQSRALRVGTNVYLRHLNTDTYTEHTHSHTKRDTTIHCSLSTQRHLSQPLSQ